MKHFLHASIQALLLGLAAADWQFPTEDVEKGFFFVAPLAGIPDRVGEQHGPRQAAPYIVRDDGELVWSGYVYYSIWATNFQAARWNGKDVLFSFEGDHNPAYGHGHGRVTILDQHYETMRELRAGNHKLVDKHEFHVINEETALIQVYEPVPRDLSEWGAKPQQQWIVDAIFQELDIASGKLLFEWSSLKHVTPSAGAGYDSLDAWDYFHINSVDKDGFGNYLISARDACSIHKIDGKTGEILWRLAGKNSSFTLGGGADFCFQHHARFISQDGDEEVISFYDNFAHGTEDGRGKEVRTARTSSGKIVRVNTKTWKAELVQAFFPPDDLLSKSQGGTQVLPNGNVLVNWGSEGAVTEFLANGRPIFHAYMDSGFLGEGVRNYRAFRYNWTGIPNEEPAIVAIEEKERSSIYVSWNGDTETRVWRFFAVVDEYGSRQFLGQANRTGFETVYKVKGVRVERVITDAVGVDGNILKTTGTAELESEILPASSWALAGFNAEEPLIQKRV